MPVSPYQDYLRRQKARKTNNKLNLSIPHEGRAEYKVHLTKDNLKKIVFQDRTLFCVVFECPKCNQWVTWTPPEFKGARKSFKKEKARELGFTDTQPICKCYFEWSVSIEAKARRI